MDVSYCDVVRFLFQTIGISDQTPGPRKRSIHIYPFFKRSYGVLRLKDLLVLN